jgi:uncharacterized membrane protein
VKRAVALAGTGAAVLAALAILRHDRYRTGGFDLGIFDQQVWLYSHFHVGPNTVKRTHDLLGDHFHPILMALAPLYWIWDDARVLLVAQACLLAGAALPVYLWARERIGERAALLVEAAFLCFAGLVAGALFDFHELAVGTLGISVALYGLVTRRSWPFWTGAVVALLSKEDLALTVAAMGLYALVVQRRRLFGGSLLVGCAAWFFVVVDAVMPAIAGHRYSYWRLSVGGDAQGLVRVTLTRPWRVVAALGDRSGKWWLLVGALGSWAFLPVLSPLVLVAVPNLVERLLSRDSSYWELGRFQYSLPLTPILAFATVDTLARVRRPQAAWLVLAMAIAVTLVAAPWHELDGMVSAAEAGRIDRCLRQIPAGASVSATDRVLPHLTHRRLAYPLFVGEPTRYVVVKADRLTESPGRLLCSAGTVAVLRR